MPPHECNNYIWILKKNQKPKTKTPKMQDMKFIDDLNTCTTNLNSKIYKIIRVNPTKGVLE